jgi:YD repeat-containing protein
MGNIIESIDGNGHCIKTQYTVRGQPYRIEYPDGSTEEKEYTLDGLLCKEIARNGTITTYVHDPFGRVIQTEVRDTQTF